MAGSPDSSESIEGAIGSSPSAPGRATQFSGVAAPPSSTATRDIRKDPIPAPGAPGSDSQPAAAPAASSSQPHSAPQAGGSGKSMFDETPEQAAAKKDQLRKLASGNKEAIEQWKQEHKDDSSAAHIATNKPINTNAQMDVEKWGNQQDPVYNSTAAAKEDYYTPAKSDQEEETEDVTVAATKLLLTDPDKIAQVAKQTGAK